jgi:Lipase (class 3)
LHAWTFQEASHAPWHPPTCSLAYPWCPADFTYNQTSYSKTFNINGIGRVNITLPGAIHSGFAGALDAVLTPIATRVVRQVAAGSATSVQLVGHSLGGGVGTLLAYALQRALTQIPSTSNLVNNVDAVLFAPPRVGDDTFVMSFNRDVNARNVAFQYDPVPQIPCSPAMPACKFVLVPTDVPTPTINGTAWPYAEAGGLVPVLASQMPVQPEAWSKLNTLSLTRVIRFLFATHICSYLCNFAQYTGDPQNNCLLWNTSSPSPPPGSAQYCDMFPVVPPYPTP